MTFEPHTTMRRNNNPKLSPYTISYIIQEDRYDYLHYWIPESRWAPQSNRIVGVADKDLIDVMSSFVQSLDLRRRLNIKYDGGFEIYISTNMQFNDISRRGVIRFHEDAVGCVCTQLCLNYGVAYSDPKLFDLIEQFISRIYNG